MNIKSIITSITIITTLSMSAINANAHTTSNKYDNHSVTQYSLQSRKNERYIEQLENKVKRLEDLLALADEFIERYILSYDRPTRSYDNKRLEHKTRSTVVHACSMPIYNKKETLIKINTDKLEAKSDLIQQCRNKGLRNCGSKTITCDSSRIDGNVYY